MKIVHHHFDEISSTNDWAKEHFEEFDKKALTVVTALAQTKGRGQYGRVWLSPRSVNLYASFCFFVPLFQTDIYPFTHLLALAVCSLLEEMGIDSTIKWPNDILYRGKKIAGILSETKSFSQNIGIILGLGLNVNMKREELEKINQPATSIWLETGKKQDMKAVMESLQASFQESLLIYLEEGFRPFVDRFHSLLK